jgi:PQQ-like domain
VWVARYNGPGNGWDQSPALAVSPDGSTVFVTGSSQGAHSGLDYATIAYDATTGAQLWVSRYNGMASRNDQASALRLSADGGTVYVTGTSAGKTSGTDYATVAYKASTGAQLWVSRYNGMASRNDGATGLAVGPDGGPVYVTGTSMGATSGNDYATVAYDPVTGKALWTSRYNGKANRADLAYGIAVGPGGGTVYVTGTSNGTTSGTDYATVAYRAATGKALWTSR